LQKTTQDWIRLHLPSLKSYKIESLALIEVNIKLLLKFMLHSYHSLISCILLATILQGKTPEGFVPLFNGKDLAGWWGAKTEDPEKWLNLTPDEFQAKWENSQKDIKKHWSVQSGELVNDGNGLFLTSEKNYGDFELLVDYKTVAGADSGIYLRGVPQIQIWDTTKKGGKWKLGADKGSGGLWNNGKAGVPGRDPLVLADNPFGQWNKFHITMKGNVVTVILNNKLVVDEAPLINYWDRKTPIEKRRPIISTGPIQLQTHGGEIRWRNLYIKELSKSCCAEDDETGYVSLFNGENFDGWKGPISNYEIQNNSISCIKGKGGTIFTERTFKDFSVKLEFKLPAGGNNGLAIRYPGKGNAAYDGMCELQVLDNTHPRYSKLDARQFHGSAYGIAAAHKGFLKEVGKWNQQEVIVRGSQITVFLNDEIILDQDLLKINKFMAKKSHPGLALKEGHFGFAGHNDPVSFRNIRIKELY
jgi:hypothetical protein